MKFGLPIWSVFGGQRRSRRVSDMIKMGILDPTKVVRYALQNASSVSGLLLITEAMVADAPKEDAMPRY